MNRFAQAMNSRYANYDHDFDPNDDTYRYGPSLYYTDRQIASISQSRDGDDFSLIHLNIRSATKNFDDLRALLFTTKQR